MTYAGISQTVIDSLVFSPEWNILPLSLAPEPSTAKIFLIPPSQRVLKQEIATAFPNDDVRLLDSASIHHVTQELQYTAGLRILFITRTPWVAETPDEDISAFFNLIKILQGKPFVHLDVFTDKAISSPMFDCVTYPVDGVYVGLAQTLAKEQPEWTIRSFSLRSLTADTLRSVLSRSLPTLLGVPVCIADGQYGSASMQPETLDKWPKQSAFKIQGTYVIIGGGGGLGGLLADYIATRYQARLVIIGRRPQNSELLQRLKKKGATEVVYHQLDLNDRDALKSLLDGYPTIQGVVHSALVLEDASLAAMEEDTLFNVLRPKVHGTHNLVRALKGRALDFCLFFSSIQSYIANTGQSNYTAACVAKDAFADLLHNGLAINSKVINWGYWGSVGVVATEHYRERMRKLQIGSIEAEEGLAIIERFLTSACRQISVVKASDTALKKLRIRPHNNSLNGSLSTKNTVAKEKEATTLVPFFDKAGASVARNVEISAYLQAYTRWRLSQVNLPALVRPRFDKLFSAIQTIAPGQPVLLNQYPELDGHIKLVDQCLAHLPDILQGNTDPLSVIFPDGNFDLVEPVYRDNPIADYFNRVVAEIVENYQNNNTDRPLRIIEIGAGTGSTSKFVLPQLRPGNVSYTFTDVSFAFLNKARRRFTEYSFVEYKICNIEEPPEFDAPFDIVIATNVIHATADLPKTLANVRDLLGNDGIFILNEITSCTDYATLTFGLTDGWWLSQDPYRIPNSPLVSGESWRDLMFKSGFFEVEAHGGDDQQVMVAHTKAATQDLPVISDDYSGQGRFEAFLSQVISEVMHFNLSEIEIHVPFNEMGIDSLISMELLKPIKEKTGYLPATILFEYPTIAKLAAHLLKTGVSWSALNFPLPTDMPIDAGDQEIVTSVDERRYQNDVMSSVKAIIADTMMMAVDEIDPDTPFQEYGVDSIISLELIRPLKDLFGYLPATILFEYPTLRRLSAYLELKTTSESVIAGNDSIEAAATIGGTDSIKGAEIIENVAPDVSWQPDDIAIIGMSSRLPKAGDVATFWENLREGRDCTDIIPAERWVQDDFITSSPANGRGSYTNRGAFIDDIDAFDHEFFCLTPNEAVKMDPQERIILEQTYRVMLDAGYSRKALAGSDTAVYVGVMNGDYALHTPVDESVAPSTSLFWSMANRASYFFDWHGPSMAVDTACSASLTALHLACQGLKSGDCDQAVVAGVNLITHPRHYELLCSLHMLSRSEQCKPFGAQADGFVDGEGVVCLMLKRAEDAVRDKDRIYAFVKGSAINAGGRANGYTAPSPDAQTALINKALNAANMSPQDIGYVEAHGTGTELGDPIELRALTNGYDGAKSQSVRLGSVKSNVGHMESAAGLCGVLKAVLQMQHGEMVPSLHAVQLNPHLDFAQSPFVLNRELRTWPENTPRVSAVSSFGAGGGNAHVILQGAERILSDGENINGEEYVIPLSHYCSAGLQMNLDRLQDWLLQSQVDMTALAYTLACARDHDKYRVAIVCRDQTDLIRQLSVDLQQRKAPPKNHRVASEIPSHLTQERIKDIATLYESGADLPWSHYYPERKLLQVPEYVFIRHRHWIDSRESNVKGLSTLTQAHRINGEVMAPAAWTLSALCEDGADANFTNIMWKKKITAPQSVRQVEEEGRILFVGCDDDTQIFCMAERAPTDEVSIPEEMARMDETLASAMLKIGNQQRIPKQTIYADLKLRGYDYGFPLQGVQWAQVIPGVVRAFLHVDQDWGSQVSPALLDAGLQLAILMPVVGRNDESAVFMPYHLGKMIIHRLPSSEAIYCYCIERDIGRSERARVFDFYFVDCQGQVLIKLDELVSVFVQPDAGQISTESRQSGHPSSKFEVFDIC